MYKSLATLNGKLANWRESTQGIEKQKGFDEFDKVNILKKYQEKLGV